MIDRTAEITALNKKGEEFEVSIGISNARFNGKEYFIGFISDISQRKINERLKEFERKDKEALINSTQNLMWSVNQEYKLLAANHAFLKTTKKYSDTGMKIGDNVLGNQDLAPNDYIMLWKKLYKRALEGETFTYEITAPAINSQSETIIETNFNPIIIDGKVEGAACYSRDITEKRKIKNQLIDINKKLTTAQEIGKIGYWELDLITNELYWSDEVYTIWEVDKHKFKLSMQAFLDTVHRDDIEAFHEANNTSLKDYVPINFEHRINLPSGEVRWVHERGQIILDKNKQPLKFEGTVQDINAKKLAQIELEEQNNFIKSAIENLPIGIAVNRISDGQSTLMNKNFSNIYGWSRAEINQVETFFEKVYPNPEYRAKIKDQVLTDMASSDPERMNWEGVEITTKTGEKRIINAKNIPLFDQDLMISSVLDVTEKALAEQKLILSNERFQYVTKATFDVIWDWDLIKNEVFWGEGMKTVFGYKKFTTNVEEAIQKIHPDDVEEMMASLNSVINNKRLRNWTHEYRFLKADNTYAYIKNRGIVIRNMDREGIRMIGSIRDITTQKENEKQILESNTRLRNLAEHLQNAREEERIYIAREIHDELGQRLTGIKLDASWIKNKIKTIYPEGSDRIERLIEGVNGTINKVRKLATDLRPGVLDDLGLEAAIEWHLEQFKKQTNINITFQTDQLRNNYTKTIDTAVYRIFQEALTNITRHADASMIKVFLFEEHNVLNLHIEDNGKGISDARKENTSSLGLTGMRERAEILDGKFSINKQSKGGTIVKVSVPLK
ncbi:PAS domain-containing protein [Paucihalobacter sp.]|uniref:PAS domain-containing protein n=1 Tax=Paucihalobacter sp. TaxID=2850405 RepID=UPI002FE22075